MNTERRTALSKMLSFILRHRPQAVGIQLDENGWTDIDTLLDACQRSGKEISRRELDEVVATNPKQRFAISEDGGRIRASQGHSVPVDLGYQPADPPSVLFHGTVASVLPSIRSQGLQRMQRHHVHLSADETTASNVGGRRGKPVILRVDAARMRRDGHTFYVSQNGVWLTETVLPEYITFPT